MQYLLDTCVLSDFARGQAAVTAHIKGTSPETLAITTVTVMEVEYGLNATLARKLRPVMEAFMRSVHVLAYSGTMPTRPPPCGPPSRQRDRPSAPMTR